MTLALLKYQLFNDNDSKEKAPRIYKCLRIDERNNKEQDLDKYEDEIDGYIPFSIDSPLFSP